MSYLTEQIPFVMWQAILILASLIYSAIIHIMHWNDRDKLTNMLDDARNANGELAEEVERLDIENVELRSKNKRKSTNK